MLKNLMVGLATVAGVVLGLALVGGLVFLAVKVCLLLFVLFCKIVIPLVAWWWWWRSPGSCCGASARR